MSFPLNVAKYRLQELIGRGSYSDVYVANCRSNKKKVAVKIIDLELCPVNLELLRQEVSFWATSQHRNLLNYYGSFVSGSSLWFLTELMEGGSCYDILQFAYSSGFHDEVLIATVIREVVQFLIYFHHNHQVHRQIRPSNILLSNSGEVKVADFGLAVGLLREKDIYCDDIDKFYAQNKDKSNAEHHGKHCDKSSMKHKEKKKDDLNNNYSNSRQRRYNSFDDVDESLNNPVSNMINRTYSAGNFITLNNYHNSLNECNCTKRTKYIIQSPSCEELLKEKTFVGLVGYMAPETVKDGSVFSESSDIWSLGITAIELATGKNPFSHLSPIDQMKAIVEQPPPHLPEFFSPAFHDFVKQCLIVDSHKRPNAAELLNHQFLKKATDTNYIAETILNNLPPLNQRFDVIYGKRKENNSVIPLEKQPIMFIFDDYIDKESNLTKNYLQSDTINTRQSGANDKIDTVKENGNCASLKVGRFTVTIKSPIPLKKDFSEDIRYNSKSVDSKLISQMNNTKVDEKKKEKFDDQTGNILNELSSNLQSLNRRTTALENATNEIYQQLSQVNLILKAIKAGKRL
ncbi:hypothetical protein TRFO_08047 [Tritrichomonas foetus]|uniref:non-specific serine/threonine protein kinase n=1 Tax=Tritrichomonas foetus TaxID=1144522 RepID=A0A1J4JRF1_9EUKA|nr:hypothetical protein TRFO_08047 [Tritrichomonas foetus]|eukprot:OHT00092.1 hypothetical protein TRFO_08047 [Tritrichomonas foetus]